MEFPEVFVGGLCYAEGMTDKGYRARFHFENGFFKVEAGPDSYSSPRFEPAWRRFLELVS
jgi:hypothetical protein